MAVISLTNLFLSVSFISLLCIGIKVKFFPTPPDTDYYTTASFIIKLLVVYALCRYLYYIYMKTYYLETPKNIARIKHDREYLLSKQWENVKIQKPPLSATFKDIPNDQKLLINASVQGVRLTGYLGEYEYGVFDEDIATRLALSAGARCLVLEIDRLENSLDPILLYRDSQGLRYSMNRGSIHAVAKSIAGRAFSPSDGGSNDPFFVVLYFNSAPNPTSQTQDYVRFLAKVAKELNPLRDLLLGQTAQGDFRRQTLESQLFFMPTSVFRNKIIMLTNADTTLFRTLERCGLQGQIPSSEDLDFMTHVRIYGLESPSPFNTTSSQVSSIKPAAVLTTPSYWLTIPPDRIAEAVSTTKQSWTLVMTPSSEMSMPDGENLKKLYNTYGVHCVPFSLADPPQKTNLWIASGAPFYRKTWNVKSESIRFIPPKPIPISKPIPETNSNGGALTAPTLGGRARA